MKEGTVSVPHTTPALSDDDIVPVVGLSHRRSYSNGGATPVSVSLVMEHFSRAMKYHFKIPGYQCFYFRMKLFQNVYIL
jgi:hypothetical protein